MAKTHRIKQTVNITALLTLALALAPPSLLGSRAQALGLVSTHAQITPNGRYVGYESTATNLVAGAATTDNGQVVTEVFLYDRQTSTTDAVSRASNGDMANKVTHIVSISNDGRYVLMYSAATNLVAGAAPAQDSNLVYLRDRQAGTTVLVGPTSQTNAYALPTGAMSNDGSVIAYSSYEAAAQTTHCYIYDQVTGVTTELPNNVDMHVSADGQSVVYGTGTALTKHTIATGETTILPISGINDYALSPDNSRILYYVAVSQNYDLYYKDFATGATTLLLSNTIQFKTSLGFSGDNAFATYFEHADDNRSAIYRKLWEINLASGQKTLIEPDALKYVRLQLNQDGSKIAYDHYIDNPEPNVIWRPQVYVGSVDTTLGLAVPTGLTAATPTNSPALTWNSVIGADHYLVYRDGTQIASIASTTYSDAAVTQGTHSYAVAAAANTTQTGLQSSAVSLVVDKTAPTISGPAINPTVMLFTHNTTVSATAADTLSGVARGEYYIDTDPGVGHGVSMTYASGKISKTATISGLSNGNHRIYMRSLDNAGNWSTVVSVQFTYLNFN